MSVIIPFSTRIFIVEGESAFTAAKRADSPFAFTAFTFAPF